MSLACRVNSGVDRHVGLHPNLLCRLTSWTGVSHDSLLEGQACGTALLVPDSCLATPWPAGARRCLFKSPWNVGTAICVVLPLPTSAAPAGPHA